MGLRTYVWNGTAWSVYRYLTSGTVFRLTGFVQTVSASQEIVNDSTVNRLACVYMGAG